MNVNTCGLVSLKIFIYYFILLLIAMLFPFDFDFKFNVVKWLDFDNGIYFPKKGLILSKVKPLELYNLLRYGKGLTLEVIVESDDLMQDGPGRIISYSIDTGRRNFTLAQSEDRIVLRLRTDQTDPNGVMPHLVVSDIFDAVEKTHIVVTYNYNEQCLFINGKKRFCSQSLKGNFGNWDLACQLVIGNEVSGDRPWQGKIFYAGIYDRALGSEEVIGNFGRHLRSHSTPAKNSGAKFTDPIVQYRFDEKGGNLVRDTGMGGINLNLHIPNRLPWNTEIFSAKQLVNLQNNFFSFTTLPHIFLLIPFGFILYGFFYLLFESALKTVFVVLTFGLLISLGFEILQEFLPTRTSSLKDVVSNLIGVVMGIIINQKIWLSGLQARWNRQ